MSERSKTRKSSLAHPALHGRSPPSALVLRHTTSLFPSSLPRGPPCVSSMITEHAARVLGPLSKLGFVHICVRHVACGWYVAHLSCQHPNFRHLPAAIHPEAACSPSPRGCPTAPHLSAPHGKPGRAQNLAAHTEIETPFFSPSSKRSSLRT